MARYTPGSERKEILVFNISRSNCSRRPSHKLRCATPTVTVVLPSLCRDGLPSLRTHALYKQCHPNPLGIHALYKQCHPNPLVHVPKPIVALPNVCQFTLPSTWYKSGSPIPCPLYDHHLHHIGKSPCYSYLAKLLSDKTYQVRPKTGDLYKVWKTYILM